MSEIDVDVKNLFSKIGGVEPAYQELKRQSRTEQARERWPLLHSLQAEEGGEAGFPPAAPAKTSARPQKKPGLSKLFKSLEGGKTAPAEPSAKAQAQAEPLSGLFARKETRSAPLSGLFAREPEPKPAKPGGGFFAFPKSREQEAITPDFLRKRFGAEPVPQSPFSKLFEPKEGSPDYWKSMFDKLRKS